MISGSSGRRGVAEAEAEDATEVKSVEDAAEVTSEVTEECRDETIGEVLSDGISCESSEEPGDVSLSIALGAVGVSVESLALPRHSSSRNRVDWASGAVVLTDRSATSSAARERHGVDLHPP